MKLGVRGKIKAGKFMDWFILLEPTHEPGVVPDQEASYYLFIGEADPKRGFDTWYESYEALAAAVDELGEIEWLDT